MSEPVDRGDGTYCAACCDKKKRMFEEKKQQGLCSECGNVNDSDDFTFYIVLRVSQREKDEAGECIQWLKY